MGFQNTDSFIID